MLSRSIELGRNGETCDLKGLPDRLARDAALLPSFQRLPDAAEHRTKEASYGG
jgi:hypothetical protein